MNLYTITLRQYFQIVQKIVVYIIKRVTYIELIFTSSLFHKRVLKLKHHDGICN